MIGNLSSIQQEILLGLLLGDGSLESRGFKGARLQIKQAELKKEYVLWLYDHFKEFVRTPPKQRPDTNHWYFSTRYYENFESLRKVFYQNGKKVIPENFDKMFFSSLTLAVWYMDDGRLDYREKSHYAYWLSTDSFCENDVERLRRILRKTLGIDSTVHMQLCRGKKYPKMYIGKQGRDMFYKTISQFILPCFKYKLPPIGLYLDPSETTRRTPLSGLTNRSRMVI